MNTSRGLREGSENIIGAMEPSICPFLIVWILDRLLEAGGQFMLPDLAPGDCMQMHAAFWLASALLACAARRDDEELLSRSW